MFAPTATLGIYTPEEMIEHPIGPEGAIDVTEVSPDLHQRLIGTNRDEGHKPGHAESELANVAAGNHREIKPAQPKAKRQAEAETHKPGSRAAKRAERASKAPKAIAKVLPKSTQTDPKQAAKPEKSATQRKAELEQAAT